MSFTVIAPIFNEEKNIPVLFSEILNSCNKIPLTQVIFVNDSSNDNSLKQLKKIKNTKFKFISHDSTLGQSAAIHTGVISSKNDIIITIDGDLQNDPLDIPNLYKKFLILKKNKVFIQGYRSSRKDTISKIIASKIANYIRTLILGDDHPDSGCGLKIFNKKDYLLLPHFKNMHRFMPFLFKMINCSTHSIDVNHRNRKSGISKYNNFGRAVAGIYDLFGVVWLKKRYLKVFQQNVL
jgi:dolichol-phosphate mannosyltransferase|tara:strand:- start:740 stop:1450 length:711 start_codon:yes stop_codon:yes gene_type:complete